MLRAYKYALLPTPAQKEQMAAIFGCVRFTWNLALETRIMAYKGHGKTLNSFDLSAQVKELKDTDAPWLADAPAQALQMTLRNQDNAYTAFFKGGGFPQFKSKHRKQSFQLPQGVKVDFGAGKVFLPKLKWVDCVFSRTFEGAIKTVTVSMAPTGKYFVSLLVETGQTVPAKRPINRETAVGVDLGVKDFAILSDGQRFANHRFLSRNLARLRVEQRKLARKVKGSANRAKQRMVVAKLHEKIRNQRQDFLHKVSTAIVKQYDTVCLETLNTSGMMKNRCLSRAIGEMGWAEFNQMLNYKAEWQGKNIIRIGRFEPSSKICNVCGWHNKELKLSDRTWTCANGHTVDRDANAALNIRDFGLRTQPLFANVGH